MAMVFVGVFSLLIAAIDQIIKYFVYEQLSPDGRVTVIDHLFSLVYSENRGAAFGIFQDCTVVFTVITVLLIGMFLYFLAAKKFTGKLFTAAVTLIVGGGLGNLIDRIFRGFVIDYLSLSFFPPICNFADYCITIGAFLFILFILMMPDKDKVLGGGKADEEPEKQGEIGEKTDEGA